LLGWIPRSRLVAAGHLAKWAGVAPGNNITGGKRKLGKTTKGDVWLVDITCTVLTCTAAHARFLRRRPYRRSNRSTRPAVSTIFILPV